MSDIYIQVGVFFLITLAIAFVTYLKCAGKGRKSGDSNKEYFLAGGGLSWTFIAGSITLTNLSTDQLIGMNGNQMALLAWWEFAAVVGLFILAKIFLPVYYKNNCTTTTELLEKRYGDKNIRAVIGLLFLLGNVFIFLPIVLYTGSLFMQSMFDVDVSLIVLATMFALVGAAYSVLGGLRAVAVSDTYSGILLLSMGMLVVFLSLSAIDYDFSGIPAERLTLIGDNDSPLPWHVLLTGMIFIQTFYWSTNQAITQRAMAAPSLKEAQKGVFAAAIIRFIIIPPMIVLPGIVSYKLYGDVGDAAYGMIVGDVLPIWLSGAFAAAIAAAVLSTFNSLLNSSAALYVCDLHETYLNKTPNVPKISGITTIIFMVISIALVPIYAKSDSIIETIQQLFGLLSMPILSTFIVGLVFKNVDSKAAIAAVISGTFLYAFFVFIWSPFHYIHMMFITLIFSISMSLLINRFVFGNKVTLVTSNA